MRVFFVKTKNEKVIFNDTDLHHITVVLRKKVGNCIRCCSLNDNIFFDAQITNLKPLEAIIVKESIVKQTIEDLDLTCFLAIIKKNNFELVVEKLNEIGVKNIVPVWFERSQTNIFLDFKRIEKIAAESSKQCNRITPIQVCEPIKFNELVSKSKEFEYLFLADKPNFKSSIFSFDKKLNGKIGFIVGPEGGFSQKEIDTFFEIKNLNFVKLTNNILRTETAAIYLASVLYERIINEK